MGVSIFAQVLTPPFFGGSASMTVAAYHQLSFTFVGLSWLALIQFSENDITRS
jgi:hypothetical protein